MSRRVAPAVVVVVGPVRAQGGGDRLPEYDAAVLLPVISYYIILYYYYIILYYIVPLVHDDPGGGLAHDMHHVQRTLGLVPDDACAVGGLELCHVI